MMRDGVRQNISRMAPREAGAALALAVVLALGVGAAQSAQAQTFTVLYNFAGGADGGNPYAGLVRDASGNLYGTTANGGAFRGGAGAVFRLHGHNESVLYSFCFLSGCPDGTLPYSTLVRDAAGNLYGTTFTGGTGCSQNDCGTVFKGVRAVVSFKALFLRLLLVPVFAGMAAAQQTTGGSALLPGFVYQSTSCTGSACAASVGSTSPFPLANTAGDAIVVGILVTSGGGVTVSTVNDTAGNTYSFPGGLSGCTSTKASFGNSEVVLAYATNIQAYPCVFRSADPDVDLGRLAHVPGPES